MEPYPSYNRQKQKKYRSKKTVFFFGEGPGETFFLKHLQSLYHYSKLTFIRIVTGRRGTADGIVIDASKMGNYDKKVVILDNDKPQKEMEEARREAKNRNIELIENTPCLEHMLLTILSDADGKNLKSSTQYKKNFESKYMDRKKRRESSEYTKLFPKKLLNEKREKVKNLNRIISIMKSGK